MSNSSTSADPLDLRLTLESSSEHRRANDTISIKRPELYQEVKITFHRTIRVPDNHDTSELPPDLGTFPLYSVAKYSKNLPKEMAAKGGLFFPMYQREAMWIRFSGKTPFAIKIYTGGINAISGEPVVEGMATMLRRQELIREGKSTQDYIVTPKQLWLDGTVTEGGVVRQFVAMPQGSGYSVEYQVSGKDAVGGLQFEVTPQISRVLEPRAFWVVVKTLTGKSITVPGNDNYTIADLKAFIRDKDGAPIDQQRFILDKKQLEDEKTFGYYGIKSDTIIQLVLRLRGGAVVPPQALAMGLAAGGLIKQSIAKDTADPKKWDRERTAIFNVQILNSDAFHQVTGRFPPKTPVSAAEYAKAGLPFFKLYEENSSIAGKFEGLKSVKTMHKALAKDEDEEVEDESSIAPHLIVLNPGGTLRPFRTASELATDMQSLNIATF